VPLGYSLGVTILIWEGPACLAPVYEPPHCIGIEDGQVREGFEIPCGRGSDGPSQIIFLVGFSFVIFVSPTIIGVTLGIMYRHVSRQERRMGRYGEGALNRGAPQENNNTTTTASVDGGNGVNSMMRSIVTSVKSAVGRLSSRSNSNQNNSTSRVVMIRARAYTAAFFLTWSWFTAIIVLGIAGVSPPVAVWYLYDIFTPLQGFWNLMIFMYPKVMKAKRSQGGNLSWCQATTEAFCPAVNRWRERRAAKNDEREIPQEDDEKPEIPAGHQRQGDTELVPSSLSRDVRPGSEEEKTEIEA